MTHVYKFFDPDAIESPELAAIIQLAIRSGQLNAIIEEGRNQRWVSGADLEQFLAGRKEASGLVFKYTT